MKTQGNKKKIIQKNCLAISVPLAAGAAAAPGADGVAAPKSERYSETDKIY